MIVITGASDGLGLQLAKLYKNAGKKVVNVSRRASRYADVNVICDLRDERSVENATKEILKLDDTIDALINCAGVISVQKLEKVEMQELENLYRVNVFSQIMLVSKLFDRLKRDSADIVNVASTVGMKAYLDQAAYGSSKWAVRGFSANLQLEFKDLPNRVISFCTGGFESKLFEKATGHKNQDFTHRMKAEDVAIFMKQILDLPKNMEVSEVVINRKAIS